MSGRWRSCALRQFGGVWIGDFFSAATAIHRSHSVLPFRPHTHTRTGHSIGNCDYDIDPILFRSNCGHMKKQLDEARRGRCCCFPSVLCDERNYIFTRRDSVPTIILWNALFLGNCSNQTRRVIITTDISKWYNVTRIHCMENRPVDYRILESKFVALKYARWSKAWKKWREIRNKNYLALIFIVIILGCLPKHAVDTVSTCSWILPPFCSPKLWREWLIQPFKMLFRLPICWETCRSIWSSHTLLPNRLKKR